MNKIKTFFMATLIGIGGTYETKVMFDTWQDAEESGDEDLIKVKEIIMKEHPVVQVLANLAYLMLAFILWPIGLMMLLLDVLS